MAPIEKPAVGEGLDAYRPPEAQDEAPPEGVTGVWVYRSVEGLGRAMVVLFVVHAVIAAASAGMAGLVMDLLRRARAGDPALVDNLRLVTGGYGLVMLLSIGVVIALAVLFCLYLPRANRNARAMGAEGMTFTPGWSAGWMFVPIVNLWRPFYAIKEVWQASDPRLDVSWRNVEVPGLLSLWWVLSLVGLLGLRTPKDPELALQLALGVSIVGIISSLMAAVVFARLTKRQEQRRQAVQSAGTAAPGVLG